MNYKHLIGCLLMLCSHSSFALRCGRYLVEEGESKLNVIDKCGEPYGIYTHIDKRGNINNQGIGIAIPTQIILNGQAYYQYPQLGEVNIGHPYYEEKEILVEELSFNLGRGRYLQHMRFENGQLKSIHEGAKSAGKR